MSSHPTAPAQARISATSAAAQAAADARAAVEEKAELTAAQEEEDYDAFTARETERILREEVSGARGWGGLRAAPRRARCCRGETDSPPPYPSAPCEF